jgi:hypothetical protein
VALVLSGPGLPPCNFAFGKSENMTTSHCCAHQHQPNFNTPKKLNQKQLLCEAKSASDQKAKTKPKQRRARAAEAMAFHGPLSSS